MGEHVGGRERLDRGRHALEQQVTALRGLVAAAAQRREEAHVLLVELRLRGEAAAGEVGEAHAGVVRPEGLALARRRAVQRPRPAEQGAQGLRLGVEGVEDLVGVGSGL